FVQHGDRFARPGNLVSNGAYSLAEWVVQSHIRLVRNPKYWDDANTTINEVYYYATEDQASELKRYRAGEIDYTYELPYNQLRWIRENLEEELVISPYLGIYYFDYNVTRPPFKDNKALRLALNLAIDRDIITEIVTGAGEIPAYSIVPPGVWNYEPQMPEWAHWTQEQRLAEARRLYAEAGYGPDDHLHVELRYNTHQNHKKISVAIAAMWKQALGVRTNLVNQEWKVFLVVRQQKRVTEVARDAWIGDFNDAFTFAEIFHSTSGMNNAGYASPVFDELLAKASVESDLAKRRAMLEEAERVMMEDLPVIPVYYYVTKRLVKPYLDGFEPNVMDHHYTKNWRILAH
ncbi:MAG: peptide ABC transporter substrate-binding protein, partial [Oceanococcaceae bacterium]